MVLGNLACFTRKEVTGSTPVAHTIQLRRCVGLPARGKIAGSENRRWPNPGGYTRLSRHQSAQGLLLGVLGDDGRVYLRSSGATERADAGNSGQACSRHGDGESPQDACFDEVEEGQITSSE
jgi:hypothetical protein